MQMTTEIDLANKNDREILVLLVNGINNINARLDTMNGTARRQDCRLRELENWRYLIVGGLGMLTFVVVIGVSLILRTGLR